MLSAILFFLTSCGNEKKPTDLGPQKQHQFNGVMIDFEEPFQKRGSR